VLALHGFFEPPGVATACRHFGAALAKGNAGVRFRVSQCLKKDDAARAAALLREAACAYERLTGAAAAGTARVATTAGRTNSSRWSGCWKIFSARPSGY
jgi:hypothetical protein